MFFLVLINYLIGLKSVELALPLVLVLPVQFLSILRLKWGQVHIQLKEFLVLPGLIPSALFFLRSIALVNLTCGFDPFDLTFSAFFCVRSSRERIIFDSF